MATPRKKLDLEGATDRAVSAAIRQLSTWLDTRFTEEISAVKWEYPTEPEVRDIVDTGRLRASQTRQINGDEVTFTWPVEYATQVHEGGVSTRTRRPFPGRPWTKAPLEETSQKFGELLRAEIKKEDRKL